jgi:hypothetical protein
MSVIGRIEIAKWLNLDSTRDWNPDYLLLDDRIHESIISPAIVRPHRPLCQRDTLSSVLVGI